ncbi:ORF25 [Fowl aviadenovirus E]|uniref:ORF25 n=1 Tax=Fowl aviadenovirus E TaxID=190065 RepID=A0A650BZY3_9ADEN|nr:ORF25 [Fowl aviadenovirus E]
MQAAIRTRPQRDPCATACPGSSRIKNSITMQVRTPFSSSNLIRSFFTLLNRNPFLPPQLLLLLCLCPLMGSGTLAPLVSVDNSYSVFGSGELPLSPSEPAAYSETAVPENSLPPSEATTPCDDLLEEDCWFAESSADYAPIPWNTKENTSVVIPAQVAVSPSQSTTPPAVMLGIAQKAVNRGSSSKDHTSHIATGVTVAGIVILIALVIVAFRTKVKEPRPTRSIYLGVPPPDVDLTV